MASLLISIDKIANTSSVYGAYLKKYKKSSEKKLFIKPVHKIEKIKNTNDVYNEKMEEFILNKKFDIVYLDPPYNHRQYSSNYSPLNYIASYNEKIELIGKTGLIKDYNKSIFCSKVKVKDAFINMIENLNCKYIILSYNNEGLLNFDILKEFLLLKGDTILYKINYAKFKSQKTKINQTVIEYLWFVNTLEKNKIYKEVKLNF